MNSIKIILGNKISVHIKILPGLRCDVSRVTEFVETGARVLQLKTTVQLGFLAIIYSNHNCLHQSCERRKLDLGWQTNGTGCLESLWSVLHWRYSWAIRTQSCAMCHPTGWPYLSGEPGLDDPLWSLPTMLWFCDLLKFLVRRLQWRSRWQKTECFVGSDENRNFICASIIMSDHFQCSSASSSTPRQEKEIYMGWLF